MAWYDELSPEELEKECEKYPEYAEYKAESEKRRELLRLSLKLNQQEFSEYLEKMLPIYDSVTGGFK